MRMLRLPPSVFAVMTAAALAGCSTPRVVPTPVAAAPAPPAVAFAGYGNLAVPGRLVDGSYATPNRGLSAAGAVWHLRAGLNVAALSCRDADEAATVAAYNAFLASHRAAFAAAYHALATEYDSVAAFDAAMTRLYNYYALPPARAEFCATARTILTEAALVPAAGLPDYAAAAVVRLDTPFNTVFARQEQWLAARTVPAVATRVAAASAPPRLTVDPAVFVLP